MEEGRSDPNPKEAAGKVGSALFVDMEKVRQMEGSGENNVDGPKKVSSLLRLFMACMVSGGIQYGWALQLSLLSPYSQVRHCRFLFLFPPFLSVRWTLCRCSCQSSVMLLCSSLISSMFLF
jgi:hypothetical protein